MLLSSILGRVIDLNTAMGVTNQKKASAAAVELVLKDDDAMKEAAYIACSKGIHDLTTKALRRAKKDVRQGSFFGDKLRARYALDVDDRVIKDTIRLSRLEWRRVIRIREDQLIADLAHLEALREADRELAPIWDEYPDKNYGEVEAIYLRRRRDDPPRIAAG